MKNLYLLTVLISVSITCFGQYGLFKEAPDTVSMFFRSNSVEPTPPDSTTEGCLIIPNGTYVGYEKIAVFPRHPYFWVGYLDSTDTNKDSLGREWFHEVSIYIKDSLTRIAKIPFYIQNGKKIYTDSIGGIYYYSDIKKNEIVEAFIDGKKQKVTYDSTYTSMCVALDSCKYQPKNYSDAVPLYVYFYFTVRMKGKDLLIDENYQKGILFKRTKDKKRKILKK